MIAALTTMLTARTTPLRPLRALACATALCLAAPAWALDLTLEVTGLRSSNGKVLGAVYNAEQGWLKVSFAETMTDILPAEGDKPARAVLAFRNLPAGRYGAVAFHDENNNGKLDMNAMGLPTEPLGFSRGAKVVFGPPKFDAAVMDLAADTLHAITLR